MVAGLLWVGVGGLDLQAVGGAKGPVLGLEVGFGQTAITPCHVECGVSHETLRREDIAAPPQKVYAESPP